MKITALLVAFPVLFGACAQQVATCPQAVTTQRMESSTSIVGGILEADGDPRLGEPPSPKMFCTAGMATVDGAPVIYGARHCFRVRGDSRFKLTQNSCAYSLIISTTV
jgi:hypothetical protein